MLAVAYDNAGAWELMVYRPTGDGLTWQAMPGTPRSLDGVVYSVTIRNESVWVRDIVGFTEWRYTNGQWRDTDVTIAELSLVGMTASDDLAYVDLSTVQQIGVHERNQDGTNKWGEVARIDIWGRTFAADARTLLVGGYSEAYFVERVANNAPHAYPDTLVAIEDTPLSFDVAANDRDPNGDPLAASATRSPDHATAFTLAADGTGTYRAEADWCSEDVGDRFDYVVSDGLLDSEEVSVTILVMCVNDAPVIEDRTWVATEDVDLNVESSVGLIDPAYVSDVDDTVGIDTMTAHGGAVTPLHGDVTILESGGFLYVPDPNYAGPDRFSYTIADAAGAVSNEAMVNIDVTPVNDPPTAGDLEISVDEGSQLRVEAPGLLAEASDVDGDALVAELVSPAGNGVAVVFPSGAYTYTPKATFVGTDSFTWHARDPSGEVSGLATVTVTVDPVNDAPVAVDDAYSVYEDGLLEVTSQRGVLENDADPDDLNAELTVRLDTPPVLGTLDRLDGQGGFTYRPDPDAFGEDSFTYFLQDRGGAVSEVATVTIDVLPINDQPVARNEVYSLSDGRVLEVSAEQGLMTLVSDVDGDLLKLSISAFPSKGSLELEENGAFTYTADPGATGEDAFGYRVSDAGLDSFPAQVTIAITGDTTGTGTGGGTGTGTGTGDTDCVQIGLYIDRDGDGFGFGEPVRLACEPQPGLVDNDDDCDDGRADVYPGARETVGDKIDQDCNGSDGAIVPIGACQTSPGGGALWLWPLALLGLARRRRGA